MSDDRPTGHDETPVRALGAPGDAGYVLLRDVGSTYSDGAEETVLQLMRTCSDLRSDSDELIGHAKGWAQRYHLDPTRANVVRSLELPPTAKVLEVGAGCGAITRYLGETCAVVDALEPVPARAAAAAARTAELPGVRVFVGEIADVPAEPVYDLVIVVGVLEYVGAGTADLAPYQAFLREIVARLAPGGALVLAIENKLGAKYVVGAPEDHTGRTFDSIESYPAGGKARTFDRRALESLMRGAGLAPRTLGAFPDYKLTRTVVGDFPDELGADARALLYRIPRFPSPDWTRPRPRLADEQRVWRTLVEAGLGPEFVNSFVVLAGKPDGGADSELAGALWPQERCAVFYSSDRLAPLTAQTFVEQQDGELVFRRQRLAPDRPMGTAVQVRSSVTPFRAGTDLPHVIAETGVEGAGPYLQQWLELLDDALAQGDDSALDIVPHNLVLAEDGKLHPIDEELVVPGRTREQIVRRGIYLLAKEATSASPMSRWAPHTTVGDVMVALGELVGLPADGSWLDAHIADESALQTHVRRGRPAGSTDEQWRETIAKGMRGSIAKPLADLPHGERLPARHARLTKEHKQRKNELAARTTELARTKTELAAARARQVPAGARRVVAKLLPAGTRRRTAIVRLRRHLSD
jgi:SAM-dependent methyltransferase